MMRDVLDDPLVTAFVEKAEGLGELTEGQLDEGWQRLQQARCATHRPVQRARRLRFLPWLAGCAAAAGLAVWLGGFAHRPLPAQPLRYTVEGLALREGDAIEASSQAVSRLLFSDESHITLDASSRMTVEALDAQGARIGLLDGAIDVFVKPRPNGSWHFSAGPFLVRVKGTAFRLAFASARGQMALHMTSGEVEVLAPPGRAVAVRAGESLELFATPPLLAAPVAQVTAARLEPTLPPDISPAPERPRAATEPARRRATPPPVAVARTAISGTSPRTPSLAWTQWLSEGKFSQVVADAEQRGIEDVLARGRPADMAALADAARYVKRYTLSRQVLMAMRSRFTATESAEDASFFLGRLAEATSGAEPALQWYGTYLREAPQGLYAKEAMGREMRLRAGSSKERARQIARQYLERFPHGPEADLARSLLRPPE